MGQDSRENIIDLTESATKPDRATLKARLALVLTRSVIEDRLNVKLPNDRVGEWVPLNDVEIARKEALGFSVYEGEVNGKLHNDGTSKPIVGDAVYMTVDRERKELLDEIERDRYKQNHPKRDTKEERDFRKNVTSEPGGPTGRIVNESKTESVDGSKIIESLPT